jgi:ubiquinone/menaquinone biosynthesis C-methylase UbiE
MLSAAEIEGLKNDLREFYNKFPRYTTLGSFYQVTKLSHIKLYNSYILPYLEPHMRVLDVGIGAGLLTLEMARVTKEVVGIDIASKVIDFAKNLKDIETRRFKLIEDYKRKNLRTDNINKNVQFYVADAENLPFKDNYFDVIVAQDIIEHLPAPIKAINEMLRCLIPTGKCILILHTPNIDINLNIESWKKDISLMKNRDAVSKMNYNVLNSWLKRKKIKIFKNKVIYNENWANILTGMFPFLNGAKFLERYEETIILILEKNLH